MQTKIAAQKMIGGVIGAKVLFLALFVLLQFPHSLRAEDEEQPGDFYLSSSEGRPENAGTWVCRYVTVDENGNDVYDTVCKVEPKKDPEDLPEYLAPGSRVFFKRGDVWNKQLLITPRRSGDFARGLWNWFDAYGDESLPNPTFVGTGDEEPRIRVVDAEAVGFKHINVENAKQGFEYRRTGGMQGELDRMLRGLALEHMTFRNIKGAPRHTKLAEDDHRTDLARQYSAAINITGDSYCGSLTPIQCGEFRFIPSGANLGHVLISDNLLINTTGGILLHAGGHFAGRTPAHAILRNKIIGGPDSIGGLQTIFTGELLVEGNEILGVGQLAHHSDTYGMDINFAGVGGDRYSVGVANNIVAYMNPHHGDYSVAAINFNENVNKAAVVNNIIAENYGATAIPMEEPEESDYLIAGNVILGNGRPVDQEGNMFPSFLVQWNPDGHEFSLHGVGNVLDMRDEPKLLGAYRGGLDNAIYTNDLDYHEFHQGHFCDNVEHPAMTPIGSACGATAGVASAEEIKIPFVDDPIKAEPPPIAKIQAVLEALEPLEQLKTAVPGEQPEVSFEKVADELAKILKEPAATEPVKEEVPSILPVENLTEPVKEESTSIEEKIIGQVEPVDSLKTQSDATEKGFYTTATVKTEPKAVYQA